MESINRRNAPVAPDIADDLLETAEAIALFLYRDRKKTRRVFYLASEAPAADRLPVFRIGRRRIAARRSTLLRWIAEREAAASGPQAT